MAGISQKTLKRLEWQAFAASRNGIDCQPQPVRGEGIGAINCCKNARNCSGRCGSHPLPGSRRCCIAFPLPTNSTERLETHCQSSIDSSRR